MHRQRLSEHEPPNGSPVRSDTAFLGWLRSTPFAGCRRASATGSPAKTPLLSSAIQRFACLIWSAFFVTSYDNRSMSVKVIEATWRSP